jgi:hypothetical protein
MNKEEDEPEGMRLLAIWMLGSASIPAELGDAGAVREDGGARGTRTRALSSRSPSNAGVSER